MAWASAEKRVDGDLGSMLDILATNAQKRVGRSCISDSIRSRAFLTGAIACNAFGQPLTAGLREA
jgi:hypothetical protein